MTEPLFDIISQEDRDDLPTPLGEISRLMHRDGDQLKRQLVVERIWGALGDLGIGRLIEQDLEGGVLEVVGDIYPNDDFLVNDVVYHLVWPNLLRHVQATVFPVQMTSYQLRLLCRYHQFNWEKVIQIIRGEHLADEMTAARAWIASIADEE